MKKTPNTLPVNKAIFVAMKYNGLCGFVVSNGFYFKIKGQKQQQTIVKAQFG